MPPFDATDQTDQFARTDHADQLDRNDPNDRIHRAGEAARAAQAEEKATGKKPGRTYAPPRRSTTMAGMPIHDMPWWRWRSRVRSALHMLGDPRFQQECWLPGVPGWGDVTDAVYRLVEDTWLDNWSAERYVGAIFRDEEEARAVDAAVLAVLAVFHRVGADAPAGAYLADQGWAEVVRTAWEAHARLAAADGEDPSEYPRPLDAAGLPISAANMAAGFAAGAVPQGPPGGAQGQGAPGPILPPPR
ncbi:hypothetical protein FHU37_004775 [Allostreptomyces psammosilenae]|uniref:Uncharacterized protein n=1 Tax=Allostreptomyces psammosilenae TaxID=1892865 RepID=A0A852ZZI1_9ACTN|nr:hypothetical protein [Allostreptomyces psammosilenae]